MEQREGEMAKACASPFWKKGGFNHLSEEILGSLVPIAIGIASFPSREKVRGPPAGEGKKNPIK